MPLVAVSLIYLLYNYIVRPFIYSPLRKIPGPRLFAATKWRFALSAYRGNATRKVYHLHDEYGTAVRIGPSEVSFSSLSALRTIYGAGSGFERTDFYRMFDVYGCQNLFSFAGTKDHAERKKILAHAYSKSAVTSPHGIAKPLIERNVKRFLELLETEKDKAQEIFMSLHWFSLDSITGFLYGEKHGGTNSLRGNKEHRRLLDDVIDITSKKLSWYTVYMGTYTKWLYSLDGLMGRFVEAAGLLPMKRPVAYTEIRSYALSAWKSFEIAAHAGEIDPTSLSILEKLWQHSETGKQPRLGGLDIASEVADHFDAGIDTTSDTLMFAIWALSRPENVAYQERLIREVRNMSEQDWNSEGVPTVEAADKLPYLNAVLKETLRLYAPLPALEPRLLPADCMIDGYHIPAGTVVGMSPYTLHRNPNVFPEPHKFMPERWLGHHGNLAEMNRWFWAFSSGGRMCIGVQYDFPIPAQWKLNFG